MTPPASREELRDRVFGVISQISGHGAEDLEPDMYLEMDLGLDSIKMITLMDAVMKLHPAHAAGSVPDALLSGRAAGMETVGDILRLLEDAWFGGADESPPAPRAQTVAERPAGGFDGGEGPAALQAEPPDGELVIPNAAYPFLVSHQAVSTITICTAVETEGPLDPELMRRAWQAVIARHPALRAAYAVREPAESFADWRLETATGGELARILVHDLTDAAGSSPEERLKAEIEARLDERFDLFRRPLHRLEVFRTGDRKHAVVLSMAHAISDGLGIQQLVRELFEAYGRLSAGREPDLPPAVTIGAWNEAVRAINGWRDGDELAYLQRYSQSQGNRTYAFRPEPAAILRRAGEDDGMARAGVHNIRVDERTVAGLRETARRFGTTLFSVVAAAYLTAVKAHDTGGEDIILNIPTGGRSYPNADVTGMVGPFAQNLSLTFRREWLTGDAGMLRRIHDAIAAPLASGMDRAMASEAAKSITERIRLVDGRIPEATRGFIRASLKSNLYLSFVGDTRLAKRYGPLGIAGYAAYTCTNRGAIDCLVELVHGGMVITCNFDRSHYDRRFIERFARDFAGQLERLAASGGTAAEPPAEPDASSLARPGASDPEIRRMLCGLYAEIGGRPVTEADLGKDLAAELGLDSLERIRLIAKIGRTWGRVDRERLFGCRTLEDMAAVLTASFAGADGCGDGSGARPVSAETAAGPAAARETAAREAVAHEVAVREAAGPAAIPYVHIIRQCRITPDATAVSAPDGQLTYRQLDERSNRLARYLRERGVGRNTLAGILATPGIHMIVGMLGILKAGGAYVPIDPGYPAGRIRHIAGHSEIGILLTERHLMPLAEEAAGGGRIVCLALDDPAGEWLSRPAGELDIVSEPGDLMTVLYTSGSTGQPKGVMLKHEGYMNRLAWHQKQFRTGPGERIAQKTSCCFDISVWEWFWPLMHGATVCPLDAGTVRNPWKLAEWIRRERINVIHFVPSLFAEFVHAIEDEPIAFPDLRWIIFSGEALPKPVVRKWTERFGTATKLANLYGPTEASIDVTCHVIDPDRDLAGDRPIPIGKPIDGAHVKILDDGLREVAPGEIGELWIGGIQLAKGYLKDEAKTKEAFRPNPFGDVPGDVLYRTGDRASVREDGSIEYHGRLDHQLKIRGYRVELGEIEAALLACPAVREAAVVPVAIGEGTKLAACLAGDDAAEADLKAGIAGRLPEYMLPHRYFWFDRLPKTHNGKLDRRELERLVRDRWAGGGPEGAGEAAASGPGASSGVPPAAGPAGASGAAASPGASGAPGPSGAAGAPGGDGRAAAARACPLAPAQSWLMRFFDPPYLWAGYTRFSYRQSLDREAFVEAVKHLAARHDVLRCRLAMEGGSWKQVFLEPGDLAGVPVEFCDGRSWTAGEREAWMAEKIRSEILELKVDRWPLWKLVVLHADDSRHDIAVIGHHLISDVVTNHLLFSDLWHIYGTIRSGGSPGGDSGAGSFRSFAESMERRKEERLADYVAYWTGQFPSGTRPTLIAPDHYNGANDEGSAATERFALDPDLTRTLLGGAKQHFGAPVYPLLLAPLYRLVAERVRQDRVIISHRVHGRDPGDGETFFRTAGNFAVNFPLPVACRPDEPWRDQVRRIAESLKRVPLNGISYDLAGEHLPARLYPDDKLTSIRANYLGNRDLPEFAVFSFSEDHMDRRFSAPGQKRISVLEFFFCFRNGRLHLDIEYSANLHRASTVRSLGERYMTLMRSMLEEVTAGRTTAPGPAVSAAPEGILAGKTAIVTGAGRGIGRAIAVAFAREGARVALVARTKSELEETAAAIRALGGECRIWTADARRRDEVEAAVEQAAGAFGGIDILVNNAGVTKMCPFLELADGDWERVIMTNLFGTVHFCRAVLPHFVRQKSGKIINMGSDSSLIGYPLMSAYAASKHAVLGLTRSLAEEYKQQGIQVNAICPAFVDTDMTPAAFRAQAIPAERVADIALFLASPKSDAITGEAVKVFGTQDMYWFGSRQMPAVERLLKAAGLVPGAG